MPRAARILSDGAGDRLSAAEPPEPAVDSDVVVILAALLCALICVVGLGLVARCAWIRRSSSAGGAAGAQAANKGLKKKTIKSLPKLSYAAAVATAAGNGILAECPICLSEFVGEDEIRILPQCGHGFHVVCVDTWLGSHSSCPSCRRILVVAGAGATPLARCHRCGHRCGTSSTAVAAQEGGAKAREDRFLP